MTKSQIPNPKPQLPDPRFQIGSGSGPGLGGARSFAAYCLLPTSCFLLPPIGLSAYLFKVRGLVEVGSRGDTTTNVELTELATRERNSFSSSLVVVFWEPRGPLSTNGPNCARRMAWARRTSVRCPLQARRQGMTALPALAAGRASGPGVHQAG